MRFAFLALCLLLPLGAAHAADDDPTRVGDVSTTFRLVGRNDKIVVDRYDDPKVSGVSCYLSRAETGGIRGTVGLATDPSRFSIACRATGPVSVPDRWPVVDRTSAQISDRVLARTCADGPDTPRRTAARRNSRTGA